MIEAEIIRSVRLNTYSHPVADPSPLGIPWYCNLYTAPVLNAVVRTTVFKLSDSQIRQLIADDGEFHVHWLEDRSGRMLSNLNATLTRPEVPTGAQPVPPVDEE